jgi:hypothetical protein
MEEDRRIDRLMQAIESEGSFVREVEDFLKVNDEAHQRRKRQLHKDWEEKVYENIQSQIDSQLSSLRTADLSARRRELMEDYINVSNKKRYGLYRDIIIESEYDPMMAHKTMVSYDMRDGQDPLKLELNNAAERPSDLMGTPRRNLARPKGRTTLDVCMWDKLNSTPYGRFDRMFTKAPPDDWASHSLSRIPFDHYNIPRGKDALTREFPRGKRTVEGGTNQSTIFEPPLDLPPPPPRLSPTRIIE